jgi:hypothetical protein
MAFFPFYYGDKIKEDEVGGGECNTRGGNVKWIQQFSRRNWKEENTWEKLVVDVRVILNLILKKEGIRVWIRFYWFGTGPSGEIV